MTVLVTGGAGYVGFSLVRALAQRNDVDRIIVIDSLARGSYGLFVSGQHGPVPVEFRRIDILDGYGLDAILDGVDTVYHLAAHASSSLTDQQIHSFDQINHWGTAQLARSIDGADSVQRVVYLSSFAVYGTHENPVDETTPPEPNTAYGVSKLQGEAQIARLADSRSLWTARVGNVFGANPAIRLDTVINAMAFDAWTQRRVRIDGDGFQVRPFIDVSIVGRVLAELPFGDTPPGIYDLVTDNASVGEIAGLLTQIVPDLDVMYASRDIRMQRIAVTVPVRLAAFIDLDAPPLPEAIFELVQTFAGRPLPRPAELG